MCINVWFRFLSYSVSVLVDASADFVEPLIFTDIKVIIARLFYERDYKTFTDFRLFSILCSCTAWCSKAPALGH